MATNNISAEMREWFSGMGRKGGKARLVKISPEERKRIAKLAAQARWAKNQPPPLLPFPPDGKPRDSQPLASDNKKDYVNRYRRFHPRSLPLFRQAVAA